MSSLFSSLTGLTLESPGFLLLALLVPAALVVRRLRRAPAVLFAPGPAALPLPRTLRQRLRYTPHLLLAAGLLLACVALARPVTRDPLPPVAKGIDIVLCVDTSSSMAADDMAPGRARLEVAKEAAGRFVAGRESDRIGLVTFARYPDLVCPLTLDRRALGRLLGGVTLVESEGPEDATGIGTAVARAAQVLDRGESKSKVVILLTDGEENVATDDRTDEIAPLHAGQLCETLGIKLYAIAIGVEARDAGGGRSAVDTLEIERLTARTGGRFFAAKDAGAVEAVYAEIDGMEKVEFAEPRYRIEDAFEAFLAAALALVLLGHLLGRTLFVVLP